MTVAEQDEAGASEEIQPEEIETADFLIVAGSEAATEEEEVDPQEMLRLKSEIQVGPAHELCITV